MYKEHYKRLPLKNAYNVRDLGGYAAEGGTVTQWRRFLRADDLFNLDKDEINFLLDYGVNAVVDLRSVEEAMLHKNPFERHAGVKYLNVSLMSETITDVTKQVIDNASKFIPSFYMSLIQNARTAIKEIFEFFAECGGGCVIFHCAAGKDRTGITAMLLLGLCGVGKFDMIADYETTFTNLRNNAVLMAGINQYPRDVMFSSAEYIEPVIDRILNHYGGFRHYLVSAGITEENLNKVKARLV